MKLFQDDGGDDLSKIEINQEFARRYEHNKKREDLHRLEELKKRGVVGSSDSEDSDDDDDDENQILDSRKDLQFFDALLKVKKQDPLLKQKDVPLFDSDDEDEEEDGSEGKGEEEKKKKKKPMYLKDVTAKHLIEEGAEFEDEEEAKKSYYEEQEEMRREFLAAAADEDDDGDFLKVKEADGGEVKADGGGGEFEKKLDEYFGEDAEKDENTQFLKEYFMKKMWIDKEKPLKVGDDDLEEVSEDEEELEKQEEYEAGFNFRFQENAGDRVMGHARTVEGSVRKKVNARKEQRKSKEERMRIAEEERKEELKHLKNLKKKEIKEKINKIKQYAGIGEEEAWLLNEDNLEEDFDPEEYDRIMKAAFDDEYYNAEDADPEKIDADDYEDEDPDSIEKPDFDKEDELLGLPKGWDKVGSSDGFSAVRERLLKQKSEIGSEEEEDDDDDDDDEGSGSEDEEEEDSDKEMGSDHENEEGGEEEKEPEEGKRKRRKKLSLLKRAKEAMLDEYYKLDYEDTIGDLKTRFKYAKIKPNRYGLSTSEILMLDDKDLNQYVSLKKIAPYSEKEYKVKDSKRYQQKLKIKELLQQEKLDVKKSGKKKRSKDGSSSRPRPVEEGDNADVEPKLEESNANDGSISRKAKRRRREAELKLPTSRLEAYGKISTKPSKKKHKKET